MIGSKPYEAAARTYAKPVVIAGFEPLDVMQSVLMLIRQINEGRAEVENEYTRVVTRDGNRKAQALVAEVLELRPTFEWRGLGEVPDSALRIRDAYADFDAEKRFAVSEKQSREVKSCECPAILRGVKKPTDCKLFGTICTPDNPIGSCMVSSEGACAAYWTYGRFRAPDRAKAAEPRMSGTGRTVAAAAVDMTHGGGGRAMAELIRDLFQPPPRQPGPGSGQRCGPPWSQCRGGW